MSYKANTHGQIDRLLFVCSIVPFSEQNDMNDVVRRAGALLGGGPVSRVEHLACYVEHQVSAM